MQRIYKNRKRDLNYCDYLSMLVITVIDIFLITYSSVVSVNLVPHRDSLPIHLDQPLNMLDDDAYEFQLIHLLVTH